MLLELVAPRTYKTKENVKKAVEKFPILSDTRYIIMTSEDGRFFPVFIGQEALQAGAHFHFNILG